MYKSCHCVLSTLQQFAKFKQIESFYFSNAAKTLVSSSTEIFERIYLSQGHNSFKNNWLNLIFRSHPKKKYINLHNISFIKNLTRIIHMIVQTMLFCIKIYSPFIHSFLLSFFIKNSKWSVLNKTHV